MHQRHSTLLALGWAHFKLDYRVYNTKAYSMQLINDGTVYNQTRFQFTHAAKRIAALTCYTARFWQLKPARRCTLPVSISHLYSHRWNSEEFHLSGTDTQTLMRDLHTTLFRKYTRIQQATVCHGPARCPFVYDQNQQSICDVYICM